MEKGCLFADTLTKIYHRIVILLGFGMGVVYQLVMLRFVDSVTYG